MKMQVTLYHEGRTYTRQFNGLARYYDRWLKREMGTTIILVKQVLMY